MLRPVHVEKKTTQPLILTLAEPCTARLPEHSNPRFAKESSPTIDRRMLTRISIHAWITGFVIFFHPFLVRQLDHLIHPLRHAQLANLAIVVGANDSYIHAFRETQDAVHRMTKAG
uniref:Uncharacterized protein n=1 Tax=Lotharella globosa TaxID=91324 RepID=A0A7S4DP34_9EUKA|mmetsp:Transcript_11027/g.21901  ORF Transcript_11027/g.21901 Transcript_11027/m.21901 type:complete len:116 (+) Transcript_11027:35-382(+)